ncbi:MAG: glycosyl transferase family 4 [Candidatus Aenigmatarchaeota archaeon]|nr:MAG: glycosyl transferase family 4 [Candidatus Aenigmarchaeota archaeon]
MEFGIAAITLAVSFITTLVLTKYWIKIAKRAGIVGKDMNKRGRPQVAEAGGITVLLGISSSILVYVFFKTFYLHSSSTTLLVFASLSSLLLAGFLGFVDDILGWKIGLRQWQKPVLTIPAAIPLMVINAGVSEMVIPLIGKVDFGILYPLLIIPLGIIGAANGFNLIAGHNALEAGMGAIILGALGAVTLNQGALWVSVICFSSVAGLLGFLVYNKYPARIFPGDSLTYFIGTLIAIVAILGNVEKIAIILFIPYFIEFILKARSGFRAENFGKPDSAGRLEPVHERICSLTHVAMLLPYKLTGKRPREYDVVLLILLFELILALAVIFVM